MSVLQTEKVHQSGNEEGRLVLLVWVVVYGVVVCGLFGWLCMVWLFVGCLWVVVYGVVVCGLVVVCLWVVVFGVVCRWFCLVLFSGVVVFDVVCWRDIVCWLLLWLV